MHDCCASDSCVRLGHIRTYFLPPVPAPPLPLPLSLPLPNFFHSLVWAANTLLASRPSSLPRPPSPLIRDVPPYPRGNPSPPGGLKLSARAEGEGGRPEAMGRGREGGGGEGRPLWCEEYLLFIMKTRGTHAAALLVDGVALLERRFLRRCIVFSRFNLFFHLPFFISGALHI